MIVQLWKSVAVC